MKAISKLQDISKSLANAGIESPVREAEIILQHALNIGFTDMYRDDPEITEEQSFLLENIISRRTRREPLQYILGNVEFTGLRIQIGKGVLIPRPETELMAEYAINRLGELLATPIPHHPSPSTIFDLCTGSGCLALALAKAFPHARVYGTDISDTALSYARNNANLNGINNVTFLKGNLFEPFDGRGDSTPDLNSSLATFDLIISNPPYIRSEDIKDLQPEIKDWEPLNALDGGADGLDHYRRIVPEAYRFLKDNGLLILELGLDCSYKVEEMLRNSRYTNIELLRDLAGVERIAVGQHNKPA